MKKKLLTILVTSLVMIAAMGIFLFKMNSMTKHMEKKQEALRKEEMDTDLKTKAFEDIDKLDLQTLYISGNKKNVVTTGNKELNDIYSKGKSADIEERLTDLKKKGSYSQKDPLWAYDPFGTNPESFYLYFKTKGQFYCRYTISVDDGKVPDFTRTLDNGQADNLTKEHEYNVTGLVPGKTNYMIFRLYNKKDELADTLYYKVKMPKSYSGAQVILSSQSPQVAKSRQEQQNGLYTVFRKAPSGEKNAILLYDNSGVLRGELPTRCCNINMEEIYDTLIYALDDNTLVRVNELGQVTDCLEIPLHHIYGEYAYDGSGAVYILAQPVQSSGSLGSVVKLEINSGEVTDALDLSDIPALVKLVKHADKKNRLKGKNHMAIDSVQVVGTNQLLLGSSKYSAIMKISNVNSLMPKLDYMITDQKQWNISGKGREKKRLRRKILTKALAEGQEEPVQASPLIDSILDTGKDTTPELFRSQYGQNALVVEKDPALAEGQYYVSMLNNNAGRGSSAKKSSYYYRYLVDENAGTYALTEKERLPWNGKGGNVTAYKESFLYCLAGKHVYEEIDKTGRVIRSFKVKGDLKRVYKSDWKGFWFY